MKFKLRSLIRELKAPLIFVIVLMTTDQTLAQPHHEIDSIIHGLTSTKDDTNKVGALINLSEKLMLSSRHDEATKYLQEGLALAKQLSYRKGMVRIHSNLGRYYSNLGNHSEALKNCLSCLELTQAAGDKKWIASSYLNLGACYKVKGDYQEAMKNYAISLKFFEELGDKEGKGSERLIKISEIFIRIKAIIRKP